MKSILAFFIALTLAVTSPAADTSSNANGSAAAPMKIGALAATHYYDQTMVVTGKVVQVTIRPAVTFLNLDQPYPDSPFAIVILHGKSGYEGDVNSLRGKSIEILGTIKNYHDKPEILLERTNQLTVLDSTNSLSAAPAQATPPPATPATNGISEIM